MFERFTDRARRVLVLAVERAGLESAPAIGTEHLLLGMLEENESTAAIVLDRLGVDADQTRAAVKVIRDGRQPSEPSSVGAPPFSVRAKKVLELSLREALQLGHNYIGTEHILLGLIREGEGVAAQVLVKLGAELPRTRQRIIELLSGSYLIDQINRTRREKEHAIDAQDFAKAASLHGVEKRLINEQQEREKLSTTRSSDPQPAETEAGAVTALTDIAGSLRTLVDYLGRAITIVDNLGRVMMTPTEVRKNEGLT